MGHRAGAKRWWSLIDGSAHSGVVGALVLGLNPYRLFDDATRDFAGWSPDRSPESHRDRRQHCRHAGGGTTARLVRAIAVVHRGAARPASPLRIRQSELPPTDRAPRCRGPNGARGAARSRRSGVLRIARPGLYLGEAFTGQSMPISIERTPGAEPEDRFLDFVYQPIRDDAGNVTGIFVEGIDVTMAHDAVAALRESEAQFRTFAQAVPNQAWTAEPNGQLDWFNERVFEYSGCDHADLVGEGWTQIIHLEDVEAAAERAGPRPWRQAPPTRPSSAFVGMTVNSAGIWFAHYRP